MTDQIFMPIEEDCLIDDRQVSKITSMSISWPRQERFKRRQNHPHVFTIDPIMVGSSPRYRLSDVREWLLSLNSEEKADA